MATASQLQASIEPGSTEFGDRARLEQGLAAVSGAGQPAQGRPGVGAPPQGGLPDSGDPISALLAGKGASDLPVTEGMSVGPGGGPMGAEPDLDLVQKLEALAVGARTPALRVAARQSLRRLRRGA